MSKTPELTEGMVKAAMKAMPKECFFLIYDSDMRVILEAALQSAADAAPPSIHVMGPIETLAIARKAHVDAVDAYNSRREYIQSLPISARFNLDAEFRAVTVTQSAFIRTAQEVADAALAATGSEVGR